MRGDGRRPTGDGLLIAALVVTVVACRPRPEPYDPGDSHHTAPVADGSAAAADDATSPMAAVADHVAAIGAPAADAPDARKVGVLLPLSGPYARLGKEAAAGIRLAATDVPGITLVIADTAGDADRAVTELERLVRDERVLLVIGPLGARESAAAAIRAAQLAVPIALLAPSDHLAHGPAGVVRLVTSAEDQARAAARYAHARGFEQPAILAPRDDQGQAEAAAFAAEAARLGIPVVASGSYDATGVTVEEDVRRFLGVRPRADKRFAPEVGYDLLYVPDGPEAAALVATYLVYFNVELRTPQPTDPYLLRRKHGGRVPQLVQLMGGPGWHHPSLIERGGEAVEGALVVDVFVGGDEAQASWPGAAEFADGFEAAHGREPSRLAAEAYDAARLALQAARRPTRAAATRALVAARVTDGPCGPARVSATGDLERTPLLLVIDGAAFVIEAFGTSPR